MPKCPGTGQKPSSGLTCTMRSDRAFPRHHFLPGVARRLI
jgi:hypothetical protein